jgi:hypothetical protein
VRLPPYSRIELGSLSTNTDIEYLAACAGPHRWQSAALLGFQTKRPGVSHRFLKKRCDLTATTAATNRQRQP